MSSPKRDLRPGVAPAAPRASTSLSVRRSCKRPGLPAVTLTAEERTLRGSYLGSGAPARDILRFLGLHRRGKMPVEKLLTRTIRLDDINEGFDRLADGAAIRQIVTFG